MAQVVSLILRRASSHLEVASQWPSMQYLLYCILPIEFDVAVLRATRLDQMSQPHQLGQYNIHPVQWF